MAVVVQQTKITWQEHIASLEFVTVFFSWLFMLMTRLSEPFLMLATIYIICETAVPGLHNPVWESASLAIMVTAPEFVLPGSFVVARHAKQNNEPLAGWLNVLCWAFVVLMVFTIADVLIFHFVGYWLAGLMFVRCSVAVGYSILMRVMQHGKQKEVIKAPVTQQIITPQPLKVSPPVTQVSIAKSRVKSLHNSSLSGFVSMCSETFIEPVKPPVIEAVSPEIKPAFIERDTDEIAIVKPEDNNDFNALAKTYPNIQSWLSTGQRTATLEEVIEVTGRSRKMIANRIKDGTLKVSGRNPNLIRISTVIDWLKIATIPEEIAS